MCKKILVIKIFKKLAYPKLRGTIFVSLKVVERKSWGLVGFSKFSTNW